MPSETGGMRNRSGGMSVSLASPDGRVVGGGVAGLLVAASPVQVWLSLIYASIAIYFSLSKTFMRCFHGPKLVRRSRFGSISI